MATTVRSSLALLVLAAAWCSGTAFAQQLDYVPEVNDMSTVPIGPTSPLGIQSGSSAGGTGIPLGATEIRSAGISPLATYSSGTIALPGTGTICASSGASNTYDGGGMAVGSAATATAATAGSGTQTNAMATSGNTEMAGISQPSVLPTDPGTLLSIAGTSTAMGTVGVYGMCSAGSSGPPASPSTPTATTPTTPGGNPRAGIPLGSWELANLGVSSFGTIPTPALSPFMSPAASAPTPAIPTMPTTTTALPASTTPTTLAPGNVSGIQPNVSGIPALVPGLAGRN